MKKPSIDTPIAIVPNIPQPGIMIPQPSMSDPQAIAQAAIAK